MKKAYKTCKKCLLNDSIPDISIGKNDLCEICNNVELFKMHKTEMQKMFYKKMKGIFDQLKKQDNKYDILVMFSGGKDSTYVLYLLKEIYKLKVLAFTFVHPLVNSIAIQNMDQVAKKLKIKHIKQKVDERMYKEIIKKATLKTIKYKFGPKTGCAICHYLPIVSAYKYAIENKIPVIASGTDVEQAKTFGLVTKGGKLAFYRNEARYDIFFKKEFKDKKVYEKFGFNYDKYREEELPDLIFPLTIIEKNKDEIYHILSKEKLIIKSKSNSIVTNCQAFEFFNYFSYKYYNTNYNIYEYSYRMRNDEINKWLNLKNDKDFKSKYGIKTFEQIISEMGDCVFEVAQKKISKKEIREMVKKKCPTLLKIVNHQLDSLDYYINNLEKIYYFSDFFNCKLK